MEDVIKRTAGKRYNSEMDIKSAFNTIRIRETDIYKTGFITPDGHFEFLRMPFGVTNGPSTMTRAIKLAYNHLAPHNVNTYIDDILTSHDNFRNFPFRRILSQEGESRNPERTASVDRYSTLKSIQEVRSFLGFENQFRKYISNYAVIAKPLTNSLKGLEKNTSNAAIALTDDQQRSFETLKTKITSSPILAYFKQGLPTSVETDASYSGLGAVLSQDQNGKRRVIEYASRSLKDTETCYHSNELECTAIHWALTEKFRLYLLGHKFELITDNYTTAYVVAKSAINRKFARYLVDLAQSREDQFDLLKLARAEAANSVYETHLTNKRRFNLPRRSHSFKPEDLILYDWQRKGDHKLSPNFKGPFVIVRPVGAVCYEIKSTTPGNKVLKVVHVQHLRPYLKRESPIIEEDDSSEEESESAAEMQDPADDRQDVPDVTGLTSC
ncbi:retrovirus-related Pol polyprotein from transposon opus [Nephila pilipes]|uniref:RNA-directed DNA polymerase n=1 Tax=Nephila pilipes TaxID=299642 RepID=A0A8X6U5B4_NEPPI|nr:retrovirus-related Pol polyprotein from transposon opus [Nephila pilipes]